jgi:hypothetical protein
MGITQKQRGRAIFPEGVGGIARLYPTDGPVMGLGGGHFLTKGSVGAYTLAAPSGDNLRATIVNRTAFAHVITGTGLFDDGTAATSKNTLTFAAFPGASVDLVSGGGKWNVVTKNGVTVA